jgi:hypothetical protein
MSRLGATLLPFSLAIPVSIGGAWASSGCTSPESTSTPTVPCTTTTPADDDYGGCSPNCSLVSGIEPSTCTPARSVDACCVWVQKPSVTLIRSEGLHEYSSTDPTVELGCLTTPPTAGPSHTSTLSGFVKIFSSGSDTQGVTVAVFQVDTSTGQLLDQVGSSYITSASDAFETNDWLQSCSGDDCLFRHYQVTEVPTEKPLVIMTSDATGSGFWADSYDYYVYFSDDSTCAADGGPCVSSRGLSGWTTRYDATAVAMADIVGLAGSTAGNITLDPTEGIIVGEVHDCGDIRISGATVDTGIQHLGPLFYFDGDEANPLPDETRSVDDEGTSALGMFGALDLPAATPIRVSAIGIFEGRDTLLGTAVVQTYAGPSLTAITLRGRRPFQ